MERKEKGWWEKWRVEKERQREGGQRHRSSARSPKPLLDWSRGLSAAPRALYRTVCCLLPPKLQPEVFTLTRSPPATHPKLGQRGCVLGAPPGNSSATVNERGGSARPVPLRDLGVLGVGVCEEVIPQGSTGSTASRRVRGSLRCSHPSCSTIPLTGEWPRGAFRCAHPAQRGAPGRPPATRFSPKMHCAPVVP